MAPKHDECADQRGYHELFINTGGTEIYVDHNKTGHILWKIVPQGNSTYKIKVIDEDKLYGVEANSALYANSYIAVSEGKTTVDPLVDKVRPDMKMPVTNGSS